MGSSLNPHHLVLPSHPFYSARNLLRAILFGLVILLAVHPLLSQRVSAGSPLPRDTKKCPSSTRGGGRPTRVPFPHALERVRGLLGAKNKNKKGGGGGGACSINTRVN